VSGSADAWTSTRSASFCVRIMVRPNGYNVNPFGSTPIANNLPDTFPGQIDQGDSAISPVEGTPEFHSDARYDARYEYFEGVFSIPVAGPIGTPPEIVRLHAPYGVKTVKGTGERRGEHPFVPDWELENDNLVRTYRSIQPTAPIIAVDGSRIFRDTVEYSYVVVAAPQPQYDTYSCPTSVVDLNPADNYLLTPGQFVPTVFDSSGGTV